MLFSREGWKSQKLLAKVCRNCLSKRITSTPVAFSTKSTPPTLIKPTSPFVVNFRNEIHRPPPPQPQYTHYSPWVRKTMMRRESRQRLSNSYRILKQQGLISQLTQEDIDDYVATFLSNPNDPISQPVFLDAMHMLQDLKQGLFQLAQFRLQDLETLLYVVTELKLTDKALTLLTEAVEPSIACYESVIGLLATQEPYFEKVDFWIGHLICQGLTPTHSIVRSVVLAHIGLNQLDIAANAIRRFTPDLVNAEDDFELLNQVMNVFALDCLAQWRLNDARLMYLQKYRLGMPTQLIVKRLMVKCLHTGQEHTAEAMLADTIAMDDLASALICSRKLVAWYISNKNIKHAVLVWDQMEKKGWAMPQTVLEGLLLQASKLKYNVDAMRLYRRCDSIALETRVYLLRCLVNTQDIRNAYQVNELVERELVNMKPDLAHVAVRSLFILAVEAGDLTLFERVFSTSEKLGLSLTHKGLTSLVATYLTRGDVKSAKAAFQSVAALTDGPDVVDFNLLMRAVVMEDQGVDYEKIFEILSHMNLVDVLPDETTLRTMLSFYTSESDMQKSLYTQLLRRPDAVSRFNRVYLNNIAMSSLLTRHTVSHVVGILVENDRGRLFPSAVDQEIEVNGATYKMLLDACNKERGYLNLAEKLIRDMRARGMKPTMEMYDKLIMQIARNGKITKARKYIAQMEQDTGEKASIITYSHLVDGLLNLRRPCLAKKIILEDMADMTLDYAVLSKLEQIEKLLRKKKNRMNKKKK